MLQCKCNQYNIFMTFTTLLYYFCLDSTEYVGKGEDKKALFLGSFRSKVIINIAYMHCFSFREKRNRICMHLGIFNNSWWSPESCIKIENEMKNISCCPSGIHIIYIYSIFGYHIDASKSWVVWLWTSFSSVVLWASSSVFQLCMSPNHPRLCIN